MYYKDKICQIVDKFPLAGRVEGERNGGLIFYNVKKGGTPLLIWRSLIIFYIFFSELCCNSRKLGFWKCPSVD